MPKIARPVVLSEADRNRLERWVRAQFTPQQVALRSRILLMAADGKQDLEIADTLNVNRQSPVGPSGKSAKSAANMSSHLRNTTLGFNPIEFDGIGKQAGLNSFMLTAKRWFVATRAVGVDFQGGAI